MKKLLLFLFVCLSSQLVYSQGIDFYSLKTNGTLALPESEKFLAVNFDFSKALIDEKLNEAEWAALNGEDKWEEAKQEALDRIVKLMNDKMSKSRITFVQERLTKTENSIFKTNYTLYIIPYTYSKKGNNKSLFVIKNNKTGEELGSVAAIGYGGSFGSLGNLLGDGYENSGPTVAKKIAKKNKLIKK